MEADQLEWVTGTRKLTTLPATCMMTLEAPRDQVGCLLAAYLCLLVSTVPGLGRCSEPHKLEKVPTAYPGWKHTTPLPCNWAHRFWSSTLPPPHPQTSLEYILLLFSNSSLLGNRDD